MSLVELHLGWLKGVAFLEYNVCLVPRMIAAHMFDKKTFGYVAQPKGKVPFAGVVLSICVPVVRYEHNAVHHVQAQ